MIIKTDSGHITINKRTPNGKMILGYLSTGAFSGWETLSYHINKALALRDQYNLSYYNAGKLAGNIRIAGLDINTLS